MKYKNLAVIGSTDSNGPEGVLVCCECEQCGTWTIRNSVLRNTFIPRSNGCLGLASEDSFTCYCCYQPAKVISETCRASLFQLPYLCTTGIVLHWNLQISSLFNNPVIIWYVTPIILCYSYTDPICYSSDFDEIKTEDGTFALK